MKLIVTRYTRIPEHRIAMCVSANFFLVVVSCMLKIFSHLIFARSLLFSNVYALTLGACVLFHFRLTKSDPFLVIIVRACCAGLRFMCAKIPFVSVAVDSNRLFFSLTLYLCGSSHDCSLRSRSGL